MIDPAAIGTLLIRRRSDSAHAAGATHAADARWSLSEGRWGEPEAIGMGQTPAPRPAGARVVIAAALRRTAAALDPQPHMVVSDMSRAPRRS